MFIVLLLSFTMLFMSFLLAFISLLLSDSPSSFITREDYSPYECGFEMSSDVRLPFSMRYFFLTLVFLIFDLEIVFLIFIPFLFYNFFGLFFLLSIMVFIIILLIGLFYEWYSGSLDWVSMSS